jgi:NAD(P)-dependent dehydrogenase (short-subunit alcohol dehydrogenase family)
MQAAENVKDETWQRVMDINVTGVMRGLRQIIPVFLKNGGGTIVNMASIAGLTGGRGGLAYTAAKHAVVGMTKNIASQYGPQNIRCNAIAPAHIETGFAAAMTNVDQFGLEVATRGVNLMPKAGTVQDISNIAVFLASDESAYINGVALAADAGWSAY